MLLNLRSVCFLPPMEFLCDLFVEVCQPTSHFNPFFSSALWFLSKPLEWHLAAERPEARSLLKPSYPLTFQYIEQAILAIMLSSLTETFSTSDSAPNASKHAWVHDNEIFQMTKTIVFISAFFRQSLHFSLNLWLVLVWPLYN